MATVASLPSRKSSISCAMEPAVGTPKSTVPRQEPELARQQVVQHGAPMQCRCESQPHWRGARACHPTGLQVAPMRPIATRARPAQRQRQRVQQRHYQLGGAKHQHHTIACHERILVVFVFNHEWRQRGEGGGGEAGIELVMSCGRSSTEGELCRCQCSTPPKSDAAAQAMRLHKRCGCCAAKKVPATERSGCDVRRAWHCSEDVVARCASARAARLSE